MALALYRKYRPQAFKDITDQNHVKITLEGEVAENKVAHAYLFSGPRGTGKTSMARILAKAVNCEIRNKETRKQGNNIGGEPCNKCEACTTITQGRALDVLEIDAATHTQVDNVREVIVETAKFAPSSLKYKLFIIDEAHMLSTSAWNALLKIMEEPPEHVIFILATTEAHKVPTTIISRCQRFEFHRIKPRDLIERLKFIASQERIKVALPVMESVSRLSEGCVRDAESILEQLFALGEKEITEEIAALVLPRTSLPLTLDLLEAIYRGEARRGLVIVSGAVEQGVDLEQFSTDFLETLRKVLLLKIAGPETLQGKVDADALARAKTLADGMEAARLIFLIETFAKAKQLIKGAAIAQLPLEVAVVEGSGVNDARPDQSGKSAGTLLRTRVGATSTYSEDNLRRAPARPAKTNRLEENQTKAGLREGSQQDPRFLPVSAEHAHVRVDLEEVKKKWPEVLKQVQQENHSLPFLLSTSEPVAVEGDTVQVGVQYPFHRDKLNEEKCRTLLERILTEICKSPMRVQGVVVARRFPKGGDSVEDVLRTIGGRLVG